MRSRFATFRFKAVRFIERIVRFTTSATCVRNGSEKSSVLALEEAFSRVSFYALCMRFRGVAGHSR